MSAVLALFNGPIQTWGFVDFLIFAIIVAACIGIVIIALREFGITIPDFVWRIFWIICCAAIAIFAIRLIAGM